MDLLELWDNFEEINSEEAKEGRLTDIINIILEEKALFLLDLICFFLEKYHTIGNLKAYSKQEIKEEFPWNRSQLQFLLRKAINQKIVIYHHRRYLLNVENSLVKRLWNYFFAPEALGNRIRELDTNFKLINENKKLGEEISLMQHELQNDNDSTMNNEIMGVKNGIFEILTDKIDHREALIEFWKGKLLYLVSSREISIKI